VAKRIVDENFAKELEQVVEHLLQFSEESISETSEDEIDLPNTSGEKITSPLGKFIFKHIRPAFESLVAAHQDANADITGLYNRNLQIAQNLARVYVKTGESMAALRDDLINEFNLQLKIKTDNLERRDTVYGLNTESADFDKQSQHLKQLADDNYTHFRLDLDQLQGQFEGLVNQVADSLIELRRQNEILRASLTEKARSSRFVQPGTSHAADIEGSQPENIVLQQLLPSGDKAALCDFRENDARDYTGAKSLIALNVFDKPANLDGLKQIIESGLQEVVIKIDSNLPLPETPLSPVEWACQWLDNSGMKTIKVVQLIGSHPEEQLQAISCTAEVPVFMREMIAQLNSAFDRINARLFQSQQMAIVAEKK
jgi:hypothetical protein